MNEENNEPNEPNEPDEPNEPVEQNEHKEFSNILKVKADDKNIKPEERKRLVKNLAGAIAHGLREFNHVYLRCFSPATTFKASKAIAIARGYMSPTNEDIICKVSFITTSMNGTMKTGLCYECICPKKLE
jgi:stage V sporulation protein SpoVS